MSDKVDNHSIKDVAPGDEDKARLQIRVIGYLIGFGVAVLLTVTSFLVAGTDRVWQPSIPVAIIVLAIAQMGSHLVFFFHVTSAPDNTNNLLALAFGLLVVFLIIGGSNWIISHLNHNMMPMDQMLKMQR